MNEDGHRGSVRETSELHSGTPMSIDVDHRQSKRALRLQIGRLRRRIDRRVRSLEREGRRLTSWRTYVEQYPAYAVLAALGLGLAASAGLARGWPRLLGRHLAGRMSDKVCSGLWEEVKGIWADSKPERRAQQGPGTENG